VHTQTVEISFHKILDELPLNRFIDCIVDNNLSALIISIPPDAKLDEALQLKLSEAWDNILSQYLHRIGTHEYKMYENLYKQISLLAITLDQINLLAARGEEDKGITPGVLRMYYNDKLAAELNGLLRTNCRFNWKDLASYHAELDKCINRSKAFKIQMDLKLISFQAMEKKQKGKARDKMDRAYFTSILVTLSDFAKYMIPETIKMSEYCERLKRFNKACEDSKKR